MTTGGNNINTFVKNFFPRLKFFLGSQPELCSDLNSENAQISKEQFSKEIKL